MDYFRISKEDLGKDSKIPLVMLGTAGEVFYEMALDMVSHIERDNAENRRTVFICPVGPVGHYPIFVRLVNERRISLKNVWFFNMDEYLNDDGSYINKDSPLSFRGFMDRNVYSKIQPSLVMPEGQRIFPNPENPEEGDRLLAGMGGADVCYGGIGITGHLAFNEPRQMDADSFAELPSRTLEIAPETRATNAAGDLGGALAAMPRLCVTIGMKQILSAKKLRLYCFRDWHRAVIRQAAYGEITASFPVTLAQKHADARITFCANAAETAY